MAVKSAPVVTKNRFSVLINDERRRRGHSLKEAAAELDSCIQTVANWEKGKTSPLKKELRHIAIYLNLSPSIITRIWLENRKPIGRPRFS